MEGTKNVGRACTDNGRENLIYRVNRLVFSLHAEKSELLPARTTGERTREQTNKKGVSITLENDARAT